jgi:hypothetical protein
MKEELKKTTEEVPVEGEVEITEPLRGRAAALASYRETNPDAGEDIEDDDLYDHVTGRYNELAGANSRLAELTAEDPRLAAVLSMIAGKDKKSLPYSIRKVYGKDFLEMEDEALDEYEKTYQSELSELANDRSALEEANRNIEEYHGRLSEFAKSNSLSDEESEGLKSAIYDYAIGILNGVIKAEFIEFIWKGMNYDKDVQAAADAGMTEGKNAVIKADMKKLSASAPAGGASVGTRAAMNPKVRKSFYDGLEDVKY